MMRSNGPRAAAFSRSDATPLSPRTKVKRGCSTHEVTDVEASHLSFGEELQPHVDRGRGTDDSINIAAHLCPPPSGRSPAYSSGCAGAAGAACHKCGCNDGEKDDRMGPHRSRRHSPGRKAHRLVLRTHPGHQLPNPGRRPPPKAIASMRLARESKSSASHIMKPKTPKPPFRVSRPFVVAAKSS